ncbi:MAG: hypothetical protein QHC90_08870 [Shinella sp.]|nr:hypothetical protein [Shinella sp.]
MTITTDNVGILLEPALVGAGPCGLHAAILAGLVAGGDGHALGALLDLPPDDFDMAAGFVSRPDHAGQHCPLFGIAVHCRV